MFSFQAYKRWILRNKKLFLLGFLIKTFITIAALGLAQNTGRKTEVLQIKTSAVCGMCKDRIEKGIGFEKGIQDVSLDLKTKIATVTYKPRKTTPEKIRKAISNLGHDADDVAADPRAYDKLPACCKKDAAPH